MTPFFRYLPYILPVLIGIGIIFLIPAGGTIEPVHRDFDFHASQFEFSPGRIVVNRGDTVVITLHADDVTHGFYLDGYGLDTRVVPGVSQQIMFTAENAGKFKFRCSVSCGRLHPFMIGELVVRPNQPFWKALGITLISLAGMLVFIWQTSKKRI